MGSSCSMHLARDLLYDLVPVVSYMMWYTQKFEKRVDVLLNLGGDRCVYVEFDDGIKSVCMCPNSSNHTH